jgi:hypothetical protein
VSPQFSGGRRSDLLHWCVTLLFGVCRVVVDHRVGKLIALGVEILFNIDTPITVCCTADGLSNHCTFPCRRFDQVCAFNCFGLPNGLNTGPALSCHRASGTVC